MVPYYLIFYNYFSLRSLHLNIEHHVIVKYDKLEFNIELNQFNISISQYRTGDLVFYRDEVDSVDNPQSAGEIMNLKRL